jgi:hypothetical protein
MSWFTQPSGDIKYNVAINKCHTASYFKFGTSLVHQFSLLSRSEFSYLVLYLIRELRTFWKKMTLHFCNKKISSNYNKIIRHILHPNFQLLVNITGSRHPKLLCYMEEYHTMSETLLNILLHWNTFSSATIWCFYSSRCQIFVIKLLLYIAYTSAWVLDFTPNRENDAYVSIMEHTNLRWNHQNWYAATNACSFSVQRHTCIIVQPGNVIG